jgi:Rieske Fe-S protein
MIAPKRNLSRRNFLNDLIVAASALKVLALVAFVLDYFQSNAPEIEFAGLVTDETGQPLTAAMIDPHTNVPAFNNGNKIFVLREGSEFTAISRICTHKRCVLKWNEERNGLRCPCHGSAFDVHGNVTKGPAKENLQSVRLVLKNDVLWADENPVRS